MNDHIRFCDTERVAPDTHVIRQLTAAPGSPVGVYVNSMVITGAEPVIVDCGPSITRAGWLEHAFEIVDPADVRWIFLSHDDVDHVGNLLQVLASCPQATLVTNWFSVERMASDYLLPLDRMRWVNPGESFHAGDRELTAVVPPTFDSPTTRGLFDRSTGVFWAADSFAMPVPHDVTDIDDLDADFVRGAVPMINSMLSPWHQWLDQAKYDRHIDEVARLGATVVASAHGPAVRGGQVGRMLDLMRTLPSASPAPLPGQAELAMTIAAITGGIVEVAA